MNKPSKVVSARSGGVDTFVRVPGRVLGAQTPTGSGQLRAAGMAEEPAASAL